ncbi:MAG: flagellar biosynthesis protein FlhB [Desulfobacteraceae bacterium]|nr:flagellar biosynthesis protein FlhB [Desulfobacteraceae bacterium]MCF8094256.1 flagellar biosynthesis protein FlhB [Desulfobacteraceae bacterium]
MADEQQEEKTEEPTEKRRREFREKGQVAQSREVNTAMLLTGLLLLWSFYAPVFWRDLKAFLAFFWRMSSELEITTLSFQQMLLFIIQKSADLLWPLLFSGVLLGLLSGYLQVGFLFTGKPMQPDLNKLDPIKGLGKLISKRSFFEALKSFGKIILVGMVAYWTLLGRFDEFPGLAGMELSAAVAYMADFMFLILLKCCVLLIFIAVIDYLFSRWEMEQKMKMTKQEVKEEHKETEGDPQLKQKVRSIQRDMARQRMMSDVPDSDVIITNPTHYAVAIRYRREEMNAPVVAAKGADHLARRIREVGYENDVPLVENPVVARGLYQVEVGDEIPEEMFKAVAEILAYVYSLKNRKNS